MGKTWSRTHEAEDYYYEVDINEMIENAYSSAYERAYQTQCERERALWERRSNNSNIRQAPPV